MNQTARDSSARWEHRLAAADIVVVGPAPPLRGGIAAHSARLVEQLHDDGVAAVAASYSRPYPPLLFPGRSLRTGASQPDWCEEILDVVAPSTWVRLRRGLATSRATVVLQWWHPVVAPALLAAIAGLDAGRLVAVCHNALPHETVPAAAAAARALLGRCSRVVCHSRAEAAVVQRLLGGAAREVVAVELPCLLPPSAWSETAAAASVAPELAELERTRSEGPGGPTPPDAAGRLRIFVAAGHQRLYKGGASLLRAWLLATRPADARLIVVGESYLRGRARREFDDLASSDPSILVVDRYVGDAELVQFLDSAQALVVAHRTASQSGLLPIARALDLPCIVSDAGGLAEQAGPDDLVVPAGDEAALALAFEACLAAQPPRVRNSSRDESARRCRFADDWRRVVEAIRMPARP